MGRQKQNKPRQQRARRRVGEIAGMLDLSAAIAEGGSGIVLEVLAVGFPGDGSGTGGAPAYIRLVDGSVKLLPSGFRDWAADAVEAERLRGASGEGTMFPRRIEFGVRDGEEYAEPL